jgi:PAS domain S-box-containing protein
MSEPSVRILLVGGMQDTRLLKDRLTAISQNLEIITAGPDAALICAGSSSFDVVLVDFPVSDTTATETIRAIRNRQLHTPVLWLSDSLHGFQETETSESNEPAVMVESRENPQAIMRAVRYAILRGRQEKARQESEARFRIACEASRAMVYDIEAASGRMLFLHGLEGLLGYVPEEVVLTDRSWWLAQIHKEDIAAVKGRLLKARKRGGHYSVQYRVRHRDGHYLAVRDTGINVLGDENRIVRSIGSVVNLTKTGPAAEALHESSQYNGLIQELEHLVEERTEDLWYLNRTLEMITDCSKDIVRATSEEQLLKDICRDIVNIGGYQVAWIGLARQDKAKTILPVAQAGQAGVCLQKFLSSWADDDQGVPAGEAIRTGTVSFHCGFQKNPAEQARCDYCSSIALPLRKQNEIFGALVICTFKKSAFNDVQVPILQELADDLAFGVTALRTRAELATALQDLEQQSTQLRTLAAELTQAEERERKRLAQAIHDDLQQLLVASKFCADTLAGGVKTPALKETARQLNDFLNQAIESARSLSFELSPPILHSTGLAKALHYLGRRMEAKHGLTVRVQAEENAEPATEELRILLFQSARELLFNVVKHAKVKTAEIDLRRFKDNHVQITVSDAGIGFDPAICASESSQNGFGLFSIRGRLDLMGGRLEIQSSPGAGSRFIMTAPLNKAALAGQAGWKDPREGDTVSKPEGGLMRAGHKTPRDVRKSK